MWYPLIGFVSFVVLLYIDRWQARRRVAKLGLIPLGCDQPGPLGEKELIKVVLERSGLISTQRAWILLPEHENLERT
jgi:hypothetical protein